MRKIGLLGNDQSLAPVQDLLASDAGLLGKKGGIANELNAEDHQSTVSVYPSLPKGYVIGGSYR